MLTAHAPLSEPAQFLLAVVADRWRLRVAGGTLYAVCPKTGQGRPVEDGLAELESHMLVVAPPGDEPRLVLTPRGRYVIGRLSKQWTGDGRTSVSLEPGAGVELPEEDA